MPSAIPPFCPVSEIPPVTTFVRKSPLRPPLYIAPPTKQRSCYPQERIEMLSEWQRVMSIGINAKPKPEPAVEHLPPSPTSPTDPGPSPPTFVRKRSRAPTDVEGDNSETRQRKKRRLRRDLITSRLSRPYASPATHIISRNAVKLGIWTGRRYLGRNIFRKAAILNSMRRDKAKVYTERGVAFPQVPSLKTIQENVDSDIVAVGKKQSTRCKAPAHKLVDIVPPAVPPVTTNYDVFDDEDSDPDGDEGVRVNILDESDSDIDESEELFPFNAPLSKHVVDPPPKDDGALELICQKSRSLMGG